MEAMTMQFYCPQGHLLEGDASQMGQACDCPICGTRFIIPTVQMGVSTGSAAPANVASANPFDFSSRARGNDRFVHLDSARPAPNAGPAMNFPNVDGGSSLAENPFEKKGPRTWHIPCPKGHELEATEELIGQEVLCPHCGEQFLLRVKDSAEYKRERELERERKEQKVAKMWFNWAVVAASIVVLGIIILVALTMEWKS